MGGLEGPPMPPKGGSGRPGGAVASLDVPTVLQACRICPPAIDASGGGG
jgi:hypothetical protein